ncbi:MAG: hypothetical protein WCK98_08010 [bacterium]
MDLKYNELKSALSETPILFRIVMFFYSILAGFVFIVSVYPKIIELDSLKILMFTTSFSLTLFVLHLFVNIWGYRNSWLKALHEEALKIRGEQNEVKLELDSVRNNIKRGEFEFNEKSLDILESKLDYIDKYLKQENYLLKVVLKAFDNWFLNTIKTFTLNIILSSLVSFYFGMEAKPAVGVLMATPQI